MYRLHGWLPCAGLVLGLWLLLPRAAHGQAQEEDPTPLIEDLRFDGVESVDRTLLEETLATRETHCRIFLLKPICALTHNHLFEVRNYLDREELRNDVLRIRVFYWLRGFRHSRVDTAVTPTDRGVNVTFNVTEGPPTLIDTVAVTQTRELLSVRSLRRWGLPSQGDRSDLTRLDSLHARVRRTLWDRGHGNAEVRDTLLLLDSLRVALDVTIDAGPITTVDTIRVEGNEKVSDRTVQRLVGLRSGDIYRRAELLEAQRRMFRSGLFRQMLIAAPDSADSAKTVLITVREAPLTAVQLGAGFNTVDFGQLQGNLTLYNFHGSARRVELRSAIGNLLAPSLYGKTLFGSAAPFGTSAEVDRDFLTPTWQLSATLTQPWFFSTKNSIGISLFSNRRSVPAIVIDRVTGASLTFTRALVHDMPLSFTYRYERSRIEAGDLYFCAGFGYCRQPAIAALQQGNSYSPLFVSLRAERTDDPLMPTNGYTARFTAEHASGFTASDWRYNRVEGEITPYFKLGRGTLVVRAHAGRVRGSASTLTALGIDDDASGNLLHPRARFYGGGSRSVRGFAEGQLGPRVLTIDPQKLIDPDTARGAACTIATIADATCDPNVAPSSEFVPRPVGGNALIEATIEYRLKLTRTLGAAVFVDAGRVSIDTEERGARARSAVTPGVGFRYLSPIGPLRVDLALRPKRVDELPVITQLQVGNEPSDLRLIELNTPKRYDPTEGPHGFLGGIFSRLQLHLYIGEAY
ncbi:MAG: BamA/OMP85 family outer membrane protein [Gemmatimonadota bacterium]